VVCARTNREESHLPLGRVQLAIGMIAQAGLKTCTSREEIVELLANAKLVAYTGEGTSGKTFLAVAEQLGLPPQFFARTTPMPAGQPVKAVAAGEFRDTVKLGAVYD